jgi:ATP-dependent Lon protease
VKFAVLPTRDAVLLPGAVNELTVGRPMSVAALRHAAASGEPVLVVLQRNLRVEDPSAHDLFHVGTLCRLTDAERMSAEAACVGVVGEERVRISSVERRGDALFAAVEKLTWAPAEPELPEAFRLTLPLMIEHGLRSQFSARTFMEMKAQSDVERLCVLSVAAPVRAEVLQGILESGELKPIVEALLSLRDQSWFARFLRWIRRLRR